MARRAGMSTLIPCRSIGNLVLKRNDTFRTLLVENEIVAFTPTEYRLLLALLDGCIAEDTSLAASVFSINHLDKPARKNLERHIENIKSKLRPTGLYISRVYKCGYILVLRRT